MIVVVLHTFKWFSIPMVLSSLLPKRLRDKFGIYQKVDRGDVFVIVLVVVMTNLYNLVYGVN